MIALLAIMAALTPAVVDYSCSLEPPQNVRLDGGKAEANAINFPQAVPADWHLGVRIRRSGDEEVATVTWAKDLFQLGGDHAALDTSPTSTAFIAVAGGGCMFSETGCMTMVHLVDTPKGTKIVITPAALASDGEAHTREPMNVVVQGSCAKTGQSK